MNRRQLLEVTIAGALAAGAAGAVRGHAAPTEGELAAVLGDLRAAMLDATATKLNRILSPQCSWGHSNGVVQTREEFVGALTSRAEVFHQLDFQEPSAFVVGGIGLVRDIFVADLLLDGAPLSVRLGELQVWQREHGSLRCIARQAYAL